MSGQARFAAKSTPFAPLFNLVQYTPMQGFQVQVSWIFPPLSFSSLARRYAQTHTETHTSTQSHEVTPHQLDIQTHAGECTCKYPQPPLSLAHTRTYTHTRIYTHACTMPKAHTDLRLPESFSRYFSRTQSKWSSHMFVPCMRLRQVLTTDGVAFLPAAHLPTSCTPRLCSPVTSF